MVPETTNREKIVCANYLQVPFQYIYSQGVTN